MSNDAHGGSRKRGSWWVAYSRTPGEACITTMVQVRELGLEEAEGQVTTATLLSSRARASWLKDSLTAARTYCRFQCWVFRCDSTEKFSLPPPPLLT